MQIRISWSTWLVVATTNNKRLKKWILTILDPNYLLGTGGSSRAGAVDNLEGESKVIEVIFPNLRTFHP